MRTYKDAKAMAKSLRGSLAARGASFSHNECLEIVAKQFGFADWNTLAAKVDMGAGSSLAQRMLRPPYNKSYRTESAKCRKPMRRTNMCLVHSVVDRSMMGSISLKAAVRMRSVQPIGSAHKRVAYSFAPSVLPSLPRSLLTGKAKANPNTRLPNRGN